MIQSKAAQGAPRATGSLTGSAGAQEPSIDLGVVRLATRKALVLAFSVPPAHASLKAIEELRGHLEMLLDAVGAPSPSPPAMFREAEWLLRITAQEGPAATPYHLWERAKALAGVTRKFAGLYELRITRPNAPTTTGRVG